RDARRCRRPSLLWAVELRREESRRRSEDRVRAPELLDLLTQRRELRRVCGRNPRRHTVIDVGLTHPRPHRLRAVTQLGRDPLDRPVIGAQLLAELTHEAHRLGLLLLGIPTRSR